MGDAACDVLELLGRDGLLVTGSVCEDGSLTLFSWFVEDDVVCDNVLDFELFG